MGIYNYCFGIEKKNYSDICKLNEEKVQKIYEEINEIRADNKISNKIEELILSYEKLFEYKNPKEEDVINYLLLFVEKLKLKKIEKNDIQKMINIYGIFISEENFVKNFPGFSRVNTLTKNNKLFELLKSDLNDDIDMKKRKAFIKQIYDLKEEHIYNYKFKEAITWENPELYLFVLYISFIDTLIKKFDYYKEIFSSMALQNNLVLEKQKEIYKSATKELIDELKIMKLCEGEFCKIYISYLHDFLKAVEKNYNKRFGNNLNWIKLEENRLIFEDYFQFLSSHNFNENNFYSITNFWQETFSPISNDEKKKIIENINNSNKKIEYKMKFELNENDLLIKKNDNVINIIKDINIYVFSNLISDLDNNYKPIHLDYYLNKNLKPNYYNTHLFVMKNKNIWKQMTVEILSSKTMAETQVCLFTSNFIDILSDKAFLNKIIDNTKYFIYETNFSADINLSTQRIYEYGLYIKDYNQNISLLFFYAFNNISYILEIVGNININIQNIFCQNNKNFESPIIEKNNSSYTSNKKKESEEMIEIELFGRIIDFLTIKEALFSLDPMNYAKGKKYFQDQFKICNDLKFQDIVNESSKETYFKKLGTDIDKLPDNIYISCPKKSLRFNDETNFRRGVLDHPIEFYYQNE